MLLNLALFIFASVTQSAPNEGFSRKELHLDSPLTYVLMIGNTGKGAFESIAQTVQPISALPGEPVVGGTPQKQHRNPAMHRQSFIVYGFKKSTAKFILKLGLGVVQFLGDAKNSRSILSRILIW